MSWVYLFSIHPREANASAFHDTARHKGQSLHAAVIFFFYESKERGDTSDTRNSRLNRSTFGSVKEAAGTISLHPGRSCSCKTPAPAPAPRTGKGHFKWDLVPEPLLPNFR